MTEFITPMLARCRTPWDKSSRRRNTRSLNLVYIMMPERNGENAIKEQTWIGFKFFFEDVYHNLKHTQKLSAGQMGYHSTNDVVQTGDIISAHDTLSLITISNQIHVDNLISKIYQLMDTNNILRYHIKQLVETNRIQDRQGKEEKNIAK